MFMKVILNYIILLNGILIQNVVSSNDTQSDDIVNDWWKSMVLYQIYPRSFKDSNGDGIGDLRGIIGKLSHLKDSGIRAAWLSPIFESPMADFGYDISNFMAIESDYGTMKDFEDLLEEANKLDIKILLDFVPNHSSDKCEWFIKSINRVPDYEDFYIWADPIIDKDGKHHPPNNWISVFYGPAWTYNEIRQQYYLHQFTSGQPDLNYRNPKVIQTMDNVLKFWLDKGVAGFRVDAVNHMFEVENLLDEPLSGKSTDPKSYDYLNHWHTTNLKESYEMIYHWRDLLNKYKEENGGDTRILCTEAYANISFTVDYYEDINGRQGSQIPFNFLLIGELNENSDARDFIYTISKWLIYMPRNGIANWVIGNHDNPRAGSRFGIEKIDQMNMLIMTLPGIAVTYNGEEIGMIDYREITWEETKDPAALNTNKEVYKKYSRDPERTPFQWDDSKNAGFSVGDTTWLPVNPNYKNLNLKKEIEEKRSHYQLYKKLVSLRKLPTLRNGNFYPLALNRNVLAYKRELENHCTIVVVINLKEFNEIVDLKILGNLPEKLLVLAAGSNSEYEEGVEISIDNLKLGKYDSIVLSSDNCTMHE
ncbi:maltase 2-like isoform X2 [Condylostylus longicornis]|uniref:maltase 2-like isoform X2 n=1 Tax=Condylostylus longicornis TaxID=2530218 RepID=UPI00244DC51E|nr:maltase 2-like isoform X2 [Condylostylus longicornis]